MPAATIACTLAAGVLGALGGARPTGLAALDALLLGLAGAALATAATEARPLPLYLAAVVPALVQDAPVPRVLGVAAMACALARPLPWAGTPAAALAGGLAWASAVGAPSEPGARPLVVPLVAMAVLLLSARANTPSRGFRRWFDGIVLAIGALALVGGGLAVLAAVVAREHVADGGNLLEAGLMAARQGNTDDAIELLELAELELAEADDTIGAPWTGVALAVPGVSQNLRGLARVVDEVRALTSAGVQAAREADVDELQVRAGHLDPAAIAAMEPPLARVLAALEHADDEIAEVADQWLLGPVRDRVEQVHEAVGDALPSARLALDAVDRAPSLLGADAPRTYLVLFTTPVEARATTGFPGSFAELRFEDGSFRMTRFGRGADLNGLLPRGGGSLTGVEEYVHRYGRFGPTRVWQNVPMSPDFPTVATVAAQLYEQTGGPAVDGVLSIDPAALAALLRLTGPMQLDGVPVPIDADNAVGYLQLQQYVDLPVTAERVDVLERLARAVMDELTRIDLPGPRALGDLFAPVVDGKHLQLAAFEPADEALFDLMGASGRVTRVEGDSVGVTTSNAAGNKIDAFLRRELAYDVRWDPDTGALTATATVTLANEAPTSGLPDYVIGNTRGLRPLDDPLPRGWNSTFVTLYSPWELAGATLDGEPVELERSDELGRHALSTFVDLPPGGTRTLVVELAGVLDKPFYVLDLLAQPLAAPEIATVSVELAGGGRLTATGGLRLDRNRASAAFPLVSDLRVGVSPR